VSSHYASTARLTTWTSIRPRLSYISCATTSACGPRFGYGLAQCGASTVIIGGVAMRSCITPVSAVTGEIRTLEGLAKDGTLHPLQQAWIDEQVPQCGYCQNARS
jgi:aerobic-type carbon monoxide dehydrogenase small subunit (CoxS/CutS family)